ncbi:glycosyltransferase [Nitratireductor sp. GCM10026969]|uniref:glycosyltransferase n=1 Tax=Nitratireductor sp. GCM10026969 TaxID=3252645 RepID=UPI00361F6DAA
MHLVFATSIVPCGTPETGYEIANAAILDALARLGIRVTVLGFAWPDKIPSDPDSSVVLGHIDVTTADATPSQKLRWLADALRWKLTFSSAKLRVIGPGELRDVLATLGPIDGVILNSVQLAGAFLDVFAGYPFIYIAHNVEHRSAEENAVAAGLPARLLYRRESRLLKALEEELCRKARFVFTLAEEDRELLGLDDAARSAALPLVTRAQPPQVAAREPTFDAVLVGTWTWAPNRIGLDWFLEAVVPLLPSGFRIAVAGRTPAGLEKMHPRVRFVGRVADASEFMRKGKVVPLVSKAGTGVQLKTIETFELGLPCVATTSSLRGIAHIPENCIHADEPRDFAAALQDLSSGVGHDVDGRDFHHAQRKALDEALRRGTHIFASSDKRQTAEGNAA